MSSTISFSLDQSKIVSSGNGLIKTCGTSLIPHFHYLMEKVAVLAVALIVGLAVGLTKKGQDDDKTGDAEGLKEATTTTKPILGDWLDQPCFNFNSAPKCPWKGYVLHHSHSKFLISVPADQILEFSIYKRFEDDKLNVSQQMVFRSFLR